MNKEKLMIITYDMIPYTLHWGGCQRMYFLAEQLAQEGFDVTVAHSLKNKVGTFGKEIHFKSLPVGFTNRRIQNFVNKRSMPKQSEPGNKSGIGKIASALLEKLLRAVDMFLFNEPNPGMGIISAIWAKDAAGAIIQALSDGGCRKVIISGPPFGAFRLASRIKKALPDTAIILDYRDPWSLWNHRGGWIYRQEKSLLKTADKVVVTNSAFRSAMCKRFALDPHKVEVLTNGYSNKDWEDVKAETNRKEKRFVISYIGSINFKGYRNVDNLFQAFSKFPGRKDTVIRFVGVSESEYTRFWQSGLGSSVEFLPRVTHKESLHEMLKSDVLLLVHTAGGTSSKYLVSAKIYDYIRSGKIVWSIGNGKALNSQVIVDNGLGLVCENNEKEILDSLLKLYESWKKKNLNEFRNQELETIEFSRECQNEKYGHLVRALEG